ncbi:MAG: cbb3-type cytochrome c oxidase subunit I [Bacteroidota bacterium]|nr:cbb3-type cytochrome c oxidase subunit I [Bacteroidota bacterium]
MEQTFFSEPIQNKGIRNTTLVWFSLSLVLFLVPAAFGFLMRSIQGNLLQDSHHLFYHFLTSHGLLMVGIWFTSAMALLTFSLSKYVKPRVGMYIVSLSLIVVGALMSLWAVFIGDMATGWYFLYPLPMRIGTATGRIVFLSSIGVLGVGWLLWSIDLLLAIAKKYTLPETLGWHYIFGESGREVPPIIMIAVVSLIAIIVCILIAVILLLLYLLEIASSVVNDALLMKNLVFVFGHTVANMNLYLVIAVFYEYFPKFGGGEFKNGRMLAIVWNSVLGIVLFAYFHHLYMDFIQPTVVQYIGQFASYGAGVAAATFTIFSVLAFVSTHKMNWNFSSLLLFISVAMWTIGGVAALIDATIPVNFKMHNTLWVPAHFHTYYFTGAATMILSFMWTIACEVSGAGEQPWMKKFLLPLLLAGASGFLLMFYFGGLHSIPRRYEVYPVELSEGTAYAKAAAYSILLFFAGYIVFMGMVLKRFLRGMKT